MEECFVSYPTTFHFFWKKAYFIQHYFLCPQCEIFSQKLVSFLNIWHKGLKVVDPQLI